MSLLFWIFSYLVDLLFWLWIIFRGGAEWLEGSFLSVLVGGRWGPEMSADGIRIFAWLSLIGTTIYFIIGLLNPDSRFF